MRKALWEDPKDGWGRRLFAMPLLWRPEAWKDPFQFLFFKGIRIIIFFLRFFGWLHKLFLTLIGHRWFTGLKVSFLECAGDEPKTTVGRERSRSRGFLIEFCSFFFKPSQEIVHRGIWSLEYLSYLPSRFIRFKPFRYDDEVADRNDGDDPAFFKMAVLRESGWFNLSKIQRHGEGNLWVIWQHQREEIKFSKIHPFKGAGNVQKNG